MKYLVLFMLGCCSIASVWAGCAEFMKCSDDFNLFGSRFNTNGLRTAFDEVYPQACANPNGDSVHPLIKCIDDNIRSCPTHRIMYNPLKKMIGYFCSPEGKSDIEKALADKPDCLDLPDQRVEALVGVQDCEADAKIKPRLGYCGKLVEKAKCFQKYVDKCGAPFSTFLTKWWAILGHDIDKRDTVPSFCQQ